MKLGIFARTFARPTLAQILDAVVQHGLESVQFNFSCVGLPTLPEPIEPALIEQIRQELAARRLTMAAVSGTFNLIHPDARLRHRNLKRLPILAAAASRLGAPVITLCTGTRDAEDMWHHHPANDSPEAWHDLRASLAEALAMTNGVMLGIEPEPANVVGSARKARRLLDEMRADRLKIVMDAANLFHAENRGRIRDTLKEAFDLLGDDIVLAHAKDVRFEGGLEYVAAGQGLVDYDLYLDLLRKCGFTGSLTLHGLAEAEVPRCVEFLRQKLSPFPHRS